MKGKISGFLALSIMVSYCHITQEIRTIHVDAMQLLRALEYRGLVCIEKEKNGTWIAYCLRIYNMYALYVICLRDETLPILMRDIN